MPDLQSALQSALKQWEDPVQTQPQPPAKQPRPRFAVTNNVSRATFAYVKANPGLRVRAICEGLVAQGFKRTSVNALVGQMVLAGMFRRDETKCYWAIVDEYTPYCIATLRRAAKAAGVRKAPPRRVPRAAAQPSTQPAVQGALAPETPVAVDVILDALTVAQAREMFNRLKRMFA